MGYLMRVFVLILGLSSFQAMAQDMKMATVDLQRIMQTSTQVQTIRQKLETEFKGRRDKLISMETELKKNMDTLKRDGAILSQSQKKDLEKKIMTAQRDFEHEGQQYQQELNTTHNEAMEAFFNQVKQAIEDYAKADSYDIIFQKDVAPYSSAKLDITDKVIQKINQSTSK